MNIERASLRPLAPFLLVGLFAAAPVGAQDKTPEPQTAPAPAPEGVIALPQSAPPTGLQAPLPSPALPHPKPDRPDKTSPRLTGKLQMRPITINEAVAVALATNRSLAQAEESLLKAQGRTSEARAGYRPTINSSLSYIDLSQGSIVTIPGIPAPITLANPDQRQINVQAALPIDILGLIRAAVDQAKFAEIAARLDINRTRNQIVLDVKSAFYDVLRAQALVTVANDTLQNTLARLDDAQKKFKAGVVARFDVIRAQTDVANAQQQLISARSQVSIAVASLNNTIGIDVNTPLQVTDSGAVETPPDVAPPAVPAPTPEGAAPEAPAAPAPQNPAPAPSTPATTAPGEPPAYDTLVLGPAYDGALAEALQTRPEIFEAEANIAAAKKGIYLAKRTQLPSLGLSWALLYAPDTAGFAPITATWQAVAQLNLPLYDGGVARARVKQAKADVATAETGKRQTIDGVTLEVRQAYLMLLQDRDRVAVANQALAEARESYRLARVRYNAGVSSQAGISPLLEVSDAQNALTQSETGQVNALYDYNNARARLDKAVGRYSYVVNGAGYAAPNKVPSKLGPSAGANK